MDFLVDTYRALHQNPELAFKETHTLEALIRILTDIGFKVHKIGGGALAIFQNNEGPFVCYRTDMDALPIQETTDLSYASTNGAMHACGHDVHMTVAVGIARRMVDEKDRWKGALGIICQPAEETGQGALKMVENGIYDILSKPIAVIGLHVAPWIETGRVATKPGPIMAGCRNVKVTIRGRGGHGSSPWLADDVISRACFVAMGIQAIPRSFPPEQGVVVSVCGISSNPVTYNVIPSSCDILVTTRAYDPKILEFVFEMIKHLSTNAQFETDVEAVHRVPPVINSEALYTKVADCWAFDMADARTASEDFGVFGGEDVPVLFHFLGCGAETTRTGETPSMPFLHSPNFKPLDLEKTIEVGIESQTAVLRRLLS